MNKKAIGFKAEYGTAVIVMMILGGVAIIAGGILFFVFIMQGAIGGAIAGGTIGAGAYMITYTITLKRLPSELVFIDDTTVYTHKSTIALTQIQNITASGKAITIFPKNGKKIVQICLKNSSECQQLILNAMQQPRENN